MPHLLGSLRSHFRTIGLIFSDAEWDQFIFAVQHHEKNSQVTRELLRVTGVGDCGRNREAADEARRIKKAVNELRVMLSGDAASGIAWDKWMRLEFVRFKAFRGEKGFERWKRMALRSLDKVSQSADEYARFYGATLTPDEIASFGREQKALSEALALFFVRAGGKLGANNGPRGGFPAFLTLVCDIMPETAGGKNKQTFARTLTKALTKAEKVTIQALSNSAVDSALDDLFPMSQVRGDDR